jgi:RNA 2',3'-cyclic 3'-phosphodiesterase
MTDQLPLAGFTDGQPPTDRLFFGLMPDVSVPPHIARTAQQLRTEHHLTGKPLTPERFHITLFHLGDYHGLPAGLVQTAQTAAATVAAHPFDVVFDRAASFAGRPGHNPLVLRGDSGLGELLAFQEKLGGALQRAGLGRQAGGPFTPHLTLLYDPQRLPEVAVEPVGWTVNEFVLVHSLLGQTRYIMLDRWPLRG